MPHVRLRKDGRHEARLRVNGKGISAYGPTEDAAIRAWTDKWYGLPTPSQTSPTSPTSSDGEETPETVEDLARLYLAHVRLHNATRTWDTYEGPWRLYLSDRFGRTPLSELRTSSIQRYFDAMIDADAWTTTIARHRTALSGALTWAVDMGWLDTSPMRRVQTPRAESGVRALSIRGRAPDIDIPNADEVRALLDANRDDPRVWSMLFTLHTLGIRPSELVGLAEDKLFVGPSGKIEIIAIHRAVKRDRRPSDPPRESKIVVEKPKWASYRELEAPRSTIRTLVEQAQRMREERAAHPRWPKEWAGFLFLDEGELIDPSRIPGLFKDACRRAGVPVRPPVSARHYCASQLLEAGIPVKRVSAWLGHRGTGQVEKTYAHILRRVRGQEPVGAAMDRILGGFGSPVGSSGPQDGVDR